MATGEAGGAAAGAGVDEVEAGPTGEGPTGAGGAEPPGCEGGSANADVLHPTAATAITAIRNRMGYAPLPARQTLGGAASVTVWHVYPMLARLQALPPACISRSGPR